MDELTIYTDGASRGNPGKAASAWLILRGDEVLESDVLTLERATNNVAEDLGHDRRSFPSRKILHPK